MLFLTIVTLPAAAVRPAFLMALPPARRPGAPAGISSAGFPGLPVLVVGDVMLDRFLVGRGDEDFA